MKKMCFLVVLLLSACKQNHPVDWYIDHDAERETRVKECNSDSAEEARPGSDCVNAHRANGLIMRFGSKDNAREALRNQ